MFAVFTLLFFCLNFHLNSWRNNWHFGALFTLQAGYCGMIRYYYASPREVMLPVYFTELGARLEIHKLTHFGHKSTPFGHRLIHFVLKLELYHGRKIRILKRAVHHSNLPFSDGNSTNSAIVSPLEQNFVTFSYPQLFS